MMHPGFLRARSSSSPSAWTIAFAVHPARRKEDAEMSQQAEAVRGSKPETGPTRIDRDRPLVIALRRREPTAAEQLVATYGDRAYRLAIRITGNDADAEEVVQDAFWSVVRKIETFKGESAFGSWLYRIVANAAYQKLRGRRVRRTDLSLDEVLPFFDEHGAHAEAGDDWSPRVEDPSLQTELRTALTSAIDELPATYRAALVLHDVEGLASGEISEALRISVANVKSRVHRARLFLRKRLGDYMTTRRRGGRNAHVMADVRVAAASAV
jgi:RNA polymerase sigma-70 factor, ECF subfamily